MESQALQRAFWPPAAGLEAAGLPPMVIPHMVCLNLWEAVMFLWVLLQVCDLGISPKKELYTKVRIPRQRYPFPSHLPPLSPPSPPHPTPLLVSGLFVIEMVFLIV